MDTPLSRREWLRWAGLMGWGALATGWSARQGWAASPPWEEKRSLMAGRTGSSGGLLGLGRPWEPQEGARLNEDPVLAMDPAGNLWMAYIQGQGPGCRDGESVVLARVTDQGVVTVLSSADWVSQPAPGLQATVPSSALQPRLAVDGDGLLVLVWLSCTAPGHWTLFSATLQTPASGHGQPGEFTRGLQVQRLAGGPGQCLTHPALLTPPPSAAATHGRVIVIYERTPQSGDTSPGTRLQLVRLRQEGWTQPEFVDHPQAQSGDSRRPALAWFQDSPWLAWDYSPHPTADLPRPNLLRVELGSLGADNRCGSLTTLAPEAGVGQWMAPSLAAAANGQRLWIGWHQNTWDGSIDIPRWFQLRALDRAGQLTQPDQPPPGRSAEDGGQVQGFEFIRLQAFSDQRVWIGGRASHNFQLQVFDTELGWSPLFRLPVDGWGGRGRQLDMVAGNGPKGTEKLWLARRDLNRLIAQELTTDWETPRGRPAPRRGIPDPDDASAVQRAAVAAEQSGGRATQAANTPTTSPRLLAVAIPAPTPATQPFQPARLAPLPVIPGPIRHRVTPQPNLDFEPWGQNHYYFGDIHGHCCLGDGTGDPDEYYLLRRDQYGLDFAALTEHDTFVGATVSPTEFEYLKSFAERYNDPGRFATLFAQEYTTGRPPRGFGHICLYSTRPDFPRYDHTDPRYETQTLLYGALREVGAIAIPHHTGWTGIHWENHDPEVEPCIEIVSVHGAFEHLGNEPIAHRGSLAGNFVQDGLARGLRYGIVGSNDCHGLIFQHGVARKRDPFRAGWVAVLAPRLDRESILQALRQRRCYATSGIRLRLEFSVDGQMMGSDYKEPAPRESARAESSARSVRVVVSSEERVKWIEIIRNNTVVFRAGGEGHQTAVTYTDRDPRQPGQTDYYYARITCHSEDMAWSSPVWVTSPQG